MGESGAGRRTPQRAGFGGLLRRLVRSDDELESEDLREAATEAGAHQITACSDRQRVVLRGSIHTVTLSPRTDSRRLEAELRDGTGDVTLIWMGRRTIPGVEAGATLKVEGRICHHDGRHVMYNPRYELLHVPGART